MLEFVLQDFFGCLRFESGMLIGFASLLAIICFTVLLVIICRDVIKDVRYNKYISTNTDRVETENVEALVVDKKCKQGRLIATRKLPVCVGNIFMVELFFGKKKYAFNDSKLYSKVKVGDGVKCELSKYISKDGKVLATELEIGS